MSERAVQIGDLSDQQLDALRLIDEQEEVDHSTLDPRTKSSLLKRKMIVLRAEDGEMYARLTPEGAKAIAGRKNGSRVSASGFSTSIAVAKPEADLDIRRKGEIEWLDELPGINARQSIIEPVILRTKPGKWKVLWTSKKKHGASYRAWHMQKKFGRLGYEFRVRTVDEVKNVYGRYTGKED